MQTASDTQTGFGFAGVDATPTPCEISAKWFASRSTSDNKDEMMLGALLGRRIKPAPNAAPAAMQEPTIPQSLGASPISVSSPGITATPIRHATKRPRPKARADVYAVYDGTGTIIGWSPEPTMMRSPEGDAKALLASLGTSDEHAGRWIIATALQEFYVNASAYERLEPFPWRRVATALTALTGGRKRYRWVREGGRRVRKRAYPIPDRRSVGNV